MKLPLADGFEYHVNNDLEVVEKSAEGSPTLSIQNFFLIGR